MVCDGEGGGVYELLRNAITWILHLEVYATAVADDGRGVGWGRGGMLGDGWKRWWCISRSASRRESFGRSFPRRCLVRLKPTGAPVRNWRKQLFLLPHTLRPMIFPSREAQHN